MERYRTRRVALGLLVAGLVNTTLTIAPAWAKPPEPCDEENDGKVVADKRGRYWECIGSEHDWRRILGQQ